MKVLICGVDGYIGFPLAVYLKERGHEILGLDNLETRNINGESVIPIGEYYERTKKIGHCYVSFLQDFYRIRETLPGDGPDVIINLAQLPRAPYSMRGFDEARHVHNNNVIANLSLLYAVKEVCPHVPIIKLGTMGEYGTPNCDIPEGEFTFEYNGREHTGLFPRDPGSWYHLTKVHDTHNCVFASKIWGLKITDIQQGIVYGAAVDCIRGKPELATRFDVDECFGTVIHRFAAQSLIGMPLTVYGDGSQTRGLLPLRESLRCLEIAMENPPSDEKPYRTFNQIAEWKSVNQLAEIVQNITGCEIQNCENPRVEKEQHYYNVECVGLRKLGYKPDLEIEKDVEQLIEDLKPHVGRIKQYENVMLPKTRWVT